MMDIDAGLLKWFINVLIKILLRLQMNLLWAEWLKLHQELRKPIINRKTKSIFTIYRQYLGC